MGANTHNNYFSSKGGGAVSLTSGYAELVSASQKIPPTLTLPLKGGREELVSEAHSKHKPHYTHLTHYTHAKRAAFTLAEVLITLALIGIVAAMTIPTLVANYQNKAWNTSAQVFERKLEEALKQMNTQQVLAGYRSTADFVGALGKYFKINKVCQNDDIMSCFEDKVYWGKNELAVSTENVKTAAQLGQQDWNTETIGVQFANGTTGILAYNPDCRENPFSNQFSGTSCLALLYDTTGFKTPNADGKDLRYINVTEIDGHKPCSFEINGTCFTVPFKPEPITKAECEQLKGDLEIEDCNLDVDYWAGAVKACGGSDKMPTMQQLADIANYIYNTSGIGASTDKENITLDMDKAAEIGLNPNAATGADKMFIIWADQESDFVSAYNRIFAPSYTNSNSSLIRDVSDPLAICVSD